MVITHTALFAILTLAKVLGPTSDEDRTRYERLATEWSHAVETADKLPVVCTNGTRCDEAKKASVLALVSIAWHESKFAANVEDCSLCVPGGLHCDAGRAVTMFQMQNGGWKGWNGNSRRALCSSNELAASTALVILTKREAPLPASFMTYAGRKKTGAELVTLFNRLIKGTGVKLRHGVVTTTVPASGA